MGKRTHIVGNSALGQRISLIPNSIIDNIVEQYKGDRYIMRFTTLEYLVTMKILSLFRYGLLSLIIYSLLSFKEK